MKEYNQNTPDNFKDHCYFWIVKVIPRLIIITGSVWIFQSIDDNFIQSFLVTLVFGPMFFYYFPPLFTIITIIPKAPDIDKNLKLYKLYTAARKRDGIYNIGNYFLIKSSYGEAVIIYNLMEKIYNFNTSDYDFKLSKTTPKDLLNKSQDLVRIFFVDHHGIDAAYALDVKMQYFDEFKFNNRDRPTL